MEDHLFKKAEEIQARLESLFSNDEEDEDLEKLEREMKGFVRICMRNEEVHGCRSQLLGTLFSTVEALERPHAERLGKSFSNEVLMQACMQNDVNVCADFLPPKNKLARLDFVEHDRTQPHFGMCPLHAACANASLDVACLFLDSAGDDVNRVSTEETSSFATPLHAAALGGHKEVIEELLKRKAEPSRVAKDGTSPLHLACARDHVECVQLLLPFAEVDIFSKSTSLTITIFDTAATFGAWRTMSLFLALSETPCGDLLQFPVGFEQATVKEFESRMRNSWNRAKENLPEVICRGILLLIQGNVGKSGREIGDQHRGKTLRLLLDFLGKEKVKDVIKSRFRGISLETECVKLDTMLHVAARKGRGHCVIELLNAGADVTIRNGRGQTALDIAFEALAKSSGPQMESLQLAVHHLTNAWEDKRIIADRMMDNLVKSEETSKKKKSKRKRKAKKKRRNPAQNAEQQQAQQQQQEKEGQDEERHNGTAESTSFSVAADENENENEKENEKDDYEDGVDDDDDMSGDDDCDAMSFPIDAIMQQVAWNQESWMPAWQKPLVLQEALRLPDPFEIALSRGSESGATNDERPQEAEVEKPIHARFADEFPKAALCAVSLENFLGFELDGLSAGQYDVLREMHLNCITKIVESQLKNVQN